MDAKTADRPFALPAESLEIVADLPVPPSVNRTRRVNYSALKIRGKWKQQAWMLCMVQHVHGKILGPFEATITLCEKQTRVDLDNIIKETIDFAREMAWVVDDGPKYLRRLVVQWGEAPEGCRLSLRSLHSDHKSAVLDAGACDVTAHQGARSQRKSRSERCEG